MAKSDSIVPHLTWKELKALASIKGLLPFLHWPIINMRAHSRVDIEAGLIGAFIAIPQAIALTSLIGIPLEYGIYASLIPSAIAMLWGSSWHTISAPNTEITLLLGGAIIPFAQTGSTEYIEYLLLLTLMIGVFQILVAIFKLGNALNFISSTVVVGITHAVAVYIIVAALSSLLDISTQPNARLLEKIYQLTSGIPHNNWYSLGIGLLTIVMGLTVKLIWPRYTLLAVFVAGILYMIIIKLTIPEIASKIPLANFTPVSFNINPLHILEFVDYNRAHDLLGSAMAIAFISLMQTEIIARSIAEKTLQRRDTNQEIIGQGLANITAPFISAFAISGSYSRSANHVEAGARTPLALFYSLLFIILIIILGQPILGQIPSTAISATLLLVGISLINIDKVRQAFLSKSEFAILATSFFISIIISLNAGILAGLLLSLVLYLRITSVPKLSTQQFVARDGKTVSSVNIDGNLFFGSVPSVKLRMPTHPLKCSDNCILLIKTDHLTYIDLPGAQLIIHELKLWRDKGNLSYVYITRGTVLRALRTAKFEQSIDKEALILRDHSHPMKHILHPYSKSLKKLRKNPENRVETREVSLEVKKLAQSLSPSGFRGPLSEKQLFSLLAHALSEDRIPAPVKLNIFNSIPLENAQQAKEKMVVKQLKAGDTILREGRIADQYYIIQKGLVEVIRSDPFTGKTKTVTRLGIGEGFGEEELLLGKRSEKTYRMRTSGTLATLSLDDFKAIIIPPMTKLIEAGVAKNLIQKGKAKLLDVRHDLEHKKARITGSRLVQLHLLNEKIKRLKPGVFYITYSNSEKRASVATFILLEHGLDSATLKGGMQNW
jgi:SulP family sulfate permease